MRLPRSALVVVGLMLSGQQARADGAFPASEAILLPADRPASIALATNFGLILSEDGGASWQWTCERPETVMGALYAVGAPPDDRLFALSPVTGLAVSSDGSCTWRRSAGALANLVATDAFPDPSDPTRVLAIAVTTGDAALGTSALYASHDGGDSFDEPPLFTAPEGAIVTGVEIARPDPRVITLTMLLPDRTPALVRSRDGGASWTTTALDSMLGSSPVRLVAVDSVDADFIVLLVAATRGDELAITRDGGLTFDKPLTAADGTLTAFVRLGSGTMLVAGLVPLSADGGGATAGVGWRSTDGGKTFQDWTLSPQPHLLALAERGGTLYLAGKNYSDGWAIATSTDEGRTIAPLSTYDRVSAMKSCAAQACRDNCDYQAGLQIWPPEVCSGAPGDGSADAGHATGTGSGCGCALGANDDHLAPVALALFAMFVASTARANRRRRPRSPRPMLLLILCGVGALTAAGGCGPSTQRPAACPDDMLTACPSPAPGFAADAAPILRAHCVKCHAPGGMEPDLPFQTYDQIAPVAGDINLQLQLCLMPPPPEAPLSLAERRTLFGWIVCGALDD